MRSTASTGYPDLVARLEGEKIVVELKAISGTGGFPRSHCYLGFPILGVLKCVGNALTGQVEHCAGTCPVMASKRRLDGETDLESRVAGD